MRRQVVRAVLGVLGVGLVLLGGGLGWLALRPVDLPFLTPRVETALEPADGSLSVAIARTRLGFGLFRGFELRLEGARALDRAGAEVLRLPSVVVQVSATPLLRGHVAVTGLELRSPSARVVRAADGNLDVVLETSGASAEPRDWGALLASFVAADGPLGSLRHLRVRDADLRFEDRASGRSWAAQGVELKLVHRSLGLRFDLTAALHAGSPETSDPQLSLKGHLGQEADATELDLELHLGPVDVARLGAWWPPGWADETRSWIVKNVSAGRVRSAELRASARLGSPPTQSAAPEQAPDVEWLSLEGGLEAEDLVVRYLAPLPEARDVRASARFDRERWDFSVAAGQVRDVTIRGGSVSILGLGEPAEPRLALDLRIDGPIATLLEILALLPVELSDALAPERAGGQAEGRLALALPLEDSASGKVDLEAEARLHDAAVEAPSPLPALTHGDFELSLKDDVLRIHGPAQLDGRPGKLSWTHHLADAQGIQHMELRGSLEPEPARAPLSFELEAERDIARWLGARARFDLDDAESSLDYTAEPGDTALSLRSPDLGALLRALTGSEKLSGGRLRADGKAPAPDAPLAGDFELEDFVLGKTALLARVVEALHLDDLPGTRQLSWQNASGEFALPPDALEIRDAVISGEFLAFTLEGRVGFASGTLDLRGEAVPLRRVNSLVGGIPVFGSLVTGGSKGLISAHYRVTGGLTDPQIRVAPWSTLVPAPVHGLLEAGGAVGRAGADALRR